MSKFNQPSNKKASTLDFNSLPNFSKSEFPQDSLEYTDANVINLMQEIRDTMPDGSGLIPSPLLDGWYRTSGSQTSRHFIGDKNSGKLSIAGDMFISNFNPLLLLARCQALGVNGVGIYLDTFYGTKNKITPLIHIDLRSSAEKSFWLRTRSKNIDPNSNDRGNVVYIYPLRDKQSMKAADEAIETYIKFNHGK